MNLEELRKLSVEDLNKELTDQRNSLRELRFNIRVAQESDTSSVAKTKKTIANVLTVLKEKSLEKKSK